MSNLLIPITITIFYIALANMTAAYLTWRIFDALGWGKSAKFIASGFIASAISWSAFSSANELIVSMPTEVRYALIIGGLLIKAGGMSCVVIGLWILYKVSQNFFVVRDPDTGAFKAASDPTVDVEIKELP
jgi:hypothetical protein